MHIQNSPPGWTKALANWPDYGLIKSVSNPDVLREARDIWAQAGRDRSKLPTIYRYYFTDYPNWDYPYTLEEMRQYWRGIFPRFIDRSYVENYASHISGVETLNEHTDTRMVTDKALLRNHLLAEQAAVDVWESDYRGRVVHTADGGEGLIPADCRLVIVNGPVGNDIPKEFLSLAIESDSWLGYHNYSFYPKGVRPPDEWQYHSGRWQANEQAYGLYPTWAFTEGGPYLDTSRGWRSPDVFNADRAKLINALGILARETSATNAAQHGRVVGPTALFTSGPWEWYMYYGDDLEACANVFKTDWKPGQQEPLDMNTNKILAECDAIDASTARIRSLALPPVPFKCVAKSTTTPTQFYHEDGTPFAPPVTRVVTWEMDVTKVTGTMLRVVDKDGTANDWWAQLADVTVL